jgi:hypothetical protein
VGRATSVLNPARLGALAVTLAAVVLWRAYAGGLPELGLWGDIAVTTLILFPVTFSVIWLLLPLANTRGLLVVAVAFGVLAWALSLAEWDSLFNVAKLITFTLAGFWFMRLFEELWWIVLVACVIPWVDAFSVWKGPTNVVIEEKPVVFATISIEFRIPGETSTANVGPPDILFFGVFLAAAARYGLRLMWTFIATVALMGLTIVSTVMFDVEGLPALPAVALGLLLPNADLIYKKLKGTRPSLTQAAR